MALAPVLYFAYAYVALPTALFGLRTLHRTYWPPICPLVQCFPPLLKCLQVDECKAWLDDLKECNDDQSEARQLAASTFSHVQHPNDAAFCQYRSFDRLETPTALDFLECIGGSGCLQKSSYSDECVVRDDLPTLSFETMQRFITGRWYKLYTTGWDLWPCQWTDFYAPGTPSDVMAPESWMTAWPEDPNVYRMDLYWKNTVGGNVTFHMCNEMYPGQMWNYSDDEHNNEYENVGPTATLKTRAVMWGTEAHENWHLIDYTQETDTIMVYYCAYTMEIQRFDSMTMVLQKDGARPLTEEQALAIETKAKALLGEKHGQLQRIAQCQ